MNDNHINYQEKADKVFEWFETNKFEREDRTVSREFELICSYADWLDSLQAGDLAEMAGLYADFKDPDDAEVAENKLYTYINKGIGRWLGDPVADLINTLKEAK